MSKVECLFPKGEVIAPVEHSDEFVQKMLIHIHDGVAYIADWAPLTTDGLEITMTWERGERILSFRKHRKIIYWIAYCSDSTVFRYGHCMAIKLYKKHRGTDRPLKPSGRKFIHFVPKPGVSLEQSVFEAIFRAGNFFYTVSYIKVFGFDESLDERITKHLIPLGL